MIASGGRISTMDGTADEINALTGSLGRIPSVSVKSMLRKDK